MPSNAKGPAILNALDFSTSLKDLKVNAVGLEKPGSVGSQGGGARRLSVPSSPSLASKPPSLKPRRVKSAIEDRRPFTLSPSDLPWSSKDWGKSQYTDDFGLKRPVTPIKIRPASATRMNNPHPSNFFLVWRYPVRTHPHKKSVAPNPDTLKDIRERFYEDYVSDERKTGQAMHEMEITNVATIPFPGNKATKSCDLGVLGRSMKVADRKSGHTSGDKVDAGRDDQLFEQLTEEEKKEIFQRTFRSSSYSAFQEWYKQASEEEKQLLLRLIQSTHKESKLQKMMSDIFKSEPLLQVHDWMQKTSDREFENVMKVLSDLKSLSKKYRKSGDKKSYDRKHRRRTKHSTWPRQKTHSQSERHLSKDSDKSSSSSRRPLSASSYASSHHVCAHCKEASTRSQLLQLERSKKVEEADVLWCHKVNRKPPNKAEDNIGGVFHSPQKYIGQHFTIHPEWPSA